MSCSNTPDEGANEAGAAQKNGCPRVDRASPAVAAGGVGGRRKRHRKGRPEGDPGRQRRLDPRRGEDPELDRDHDEAASDPQHPGCEARDSSRDHQGEGIDQFHRLKEGGMR